MVFKMDNGSDKRKLLRFNDVEKLSEKLDDNSNELLNGEIGFNRYGMNHILKSYANLSDNYKIHALFEHGVIYTENVTGAFRVHEYLPSIVPSQYRANILKKQPNFKGAYTIGPYIHYAEPLLSPEELKNEKEHLGKTLLVFPSHSIEGLVSEFNFENFCKKIDNVSDDYDTVRICMYYKDVNLKKHIPYEKRGFEVVTAGHFNDHNFIPRLKSIIMNSDMTMSNEIGSHLGYCIYLNKPHYLTESNGVTHKEEIQGENSKLMVRNEEIAQIFEDRTDNVVRIKELFANFDEKINKEQYDLISYLWGFDEVKSPTELKELFYNINENYSPIKYYFSGLIRLKDILTNRERKEVLK